LNYFVFIRTLPDLVRPQLPSHLQGFTAHQPFKWIIQMHYGEKRLHYEISRIAGQKDLELALHFESKDKQLNRYLLTGFRRHLIEIRDNLGEKVEVEMWDRGWSKVYERFPAAEITESYQAEVAQRMALLMTTWHPIFVSLRKDVSTVYR
jgi:hypothetical protein